MTDELVRLAQAEVVALHLLFVHWMRQDSDVTIDFSLCEGALAADFEMVTPAGVVCDRRAVVGRLRRARATLPADFAIDVRDPRPIWQDREAVLLKYIEQQRRLGQMTRRHSCALLTREPEAPRGMLWRYVQETWMTDEPAI